jgi:uncharacterized caspase-like protein
LRALIYAVIAFSICLPVHAEKLAFVVGINRYNNLAPLAKAVGDAEAISEVLRAAGYRTTLLTNLNRESFWENWIGFLDQIKPGDEVAFFFSGYGVQIDNANYLLVTDAPLPPNVPGADLLVRENAIGLSKLLADFADRKPRVSLIILDACRDNPFPKRHTRSLMRSRGLAGLEPPEGTFVMYSAGAGEQALDALSNGDPEPVSVYMRKLLPLLQTAGFGARAQPVQW